jgi:hypothetical protein
VPYIAEKPKLSRSIEELRSTIPGWGVDLDRADRPAVPKERFAPESTGAHWDFPERQIERWPRERSIEHSMLTPVFGTSCPPRGLSGLIRRYAYRRFSEGRTAHWMLLMLADRVDVAESRVLALAQGRPDNIIAETGVRAEIVRHGIRSRVGQHRADLVHQPLSLLGVALPALCAVGAVYLLSRRGKGDGRSSPGPSAWRGGDREQGYRSSRVRGPSRSDEPWGYGQRRGYEDGAGIGTAE